MEAEKPGWCDALNGLPGLIASSVNEAIELRRWAMFVRSHLNGLLTPGETHPVPEEVAELLKLVQEALALARHEDFFKTWESLASFRERFREKTRLGITGEEKMLSREEIDLFLKVLNAVLSAGLERSFTPDDTLARPNYINEVTDHAENFLMS